MSWAPKIFDLQRYEREERTSSELYIWHVASQIKDPIERREFATQSLAKAEMSLIDRADSRFREAVASEAERYLSPWRNAATNRSRAALNFCVWRAYLTFRKNGVGPTEEVLAALDTLAGDLARGNDDRVHQFEALEDAINLLAAFQSLGVKPKQAEIMVAHATGLSVAAVKTLKSRRDVPGRRPYLKKIKRRLYSSSIPAHDPFGKLQRKP